VETYCNPAHPAQRAIFDMYARVFDVSRDALQFGTDGCGIPAVALSLQKTAMGMARLATLEFLDDDDAGALDVVRNSMLDHPKCVRGAGFFDTDLILASQCTILVKSGAEGVCVLASLPGELGFVVKVVDGNARAIPPAVVSYLEQLGMLEIESSFLDAYAMPSLRNTREETIGVIAPRSLPRPLRSGLGKTPDAMGP